MTQMNTRYTKTAVILHWLIALFIVVMFVLGWYMADIPKEAPKQSAFDLMDLGVYTWQLREAISPRNFYFNLHKSLGLTIFMLILIRIFWRITHKPPAMLTSYKPFERKLATAVHHLLYLLMFAIPVAGLMMPLNSKYGLHWFGIKVFSGFDNKSMRDIFESVHEVLGILLLVTLALHVLGALKHKFIDKDATLKRMSL
ncbi:MAG: cytochrome b [Methylophilaceae bacterium]